MSSPRSNKHVQAMMAIENSSVGPRLKATWLGESERRFQFIAFESAKQIELDPIQCACGM